MTLLLSRRFLPLFLLQACGALNDNLFKNAMVVLVAFRSADGAPALVALAGGLFILPYLVASATSGQLADAFGKAGLVRLAKLAELAIAVLALPALLSGRIGAMLAILLLLGVQATMFSPLKYGILPELLAPGELMGGNALIEAGTFVAILLGTIAGGALIGLDHGPALVGGGVIGFAALGLLAALFVPRAPPAAPGLRIELNPATATLRLLRAALHQPAIAVAILGLSWFWAMGALFVAQFPVIVRVGFHGDQSTVTTLLASFSVGVGLGSIAIGRLSRPRAERLVPVAALGLSAATLAFVALLASPAASGWHDAASLSRSRAGVGALLCLLAASACGGAFSVPLYARLQTAAAAADRARMVAANNVMNALFMVAAAVVISLLAAAGWHPGGILLAAAVANAAVAALMWRALPRAAVGSEPRVGQEAV